MSKLTQSAPHDINKKYKNVIASSGVSLGVLQRLLTICSNKQRIFTPKIITLTASTLIFSSVALTAFATSQVDPNMIAQACEKPLEKFIHNQPLTASDEQALMLCHANQSCTNPNLSSIPGGCSLSLDAWHTQYVLAKQQQLTNNAIQSSGNRSNAMTTTNNANTAGATNTTTTNTAKPAATTAPAVSEFHSTDDAAAPATSNNNASSQFHSTDNAAAPQAPANNTNTNTNSNDTTTQPTAAPAQQQSNTNQNTQQNNNEKPSINWF